MLSVPTGLALADRKGDKNSDDGERSGRTERVEASLKIEDRGKTDIKGAVVQSMPSGTMLSVKIFGLALSVDTAAARITGRNDQNVPLASIGTGYVLEIKGTMSNNTGVIAASKIKVISSATSTPPDPPVDTTAPVISAVNVSNISTSSARVTWTTNEASNSMVYYGTSSPLNLATAQSVSSSAMTTSHGLDLTGLVQNTQYFIVAQSTNAVSLTSTSSQSTFTTNDLPPVGTVLTTALVAQHNIRANCWMIIDNAVYNLTDFVNPINEHDGGLNAIVSRCGTDGTVAFDSIGHSPAADALLATFFLGNLGDTVVLL